MPVTRFWVYWTTSEIRKANAAAETSVVRVLFKLRSYMFGRRVGFDGPVAVVFTDGTEGREKRVDEAAGDKCSADERDEVERTEKRECDWV